MWLSWTVRVVLLFRSNELAHRLLVKRNVDADRLAVVGVLLLTAATILFLLPFSIAKYAPHGWNTGYIIAMIVLGVVFGAFFTVWEKYFAPVQFMPWKYLKEPTILGSACLAAVLFISTL